MAKILQLQIKNKKGKLVNAGRMEIKNKADNSAELYFYGDIVSDSWQSYWYDEDKCPQDICDFLGQLDGTTKLDIYMNSGGGSVFAGLAIYNQLKAYKGEKVGHIMSLAASISSVIILACDKIIMHTGATYMMHKPLCRCEGNANDMRKTANTLDVCQEAIMQVYMANAKDGVTRETIENLVNQESWITSNTINDYFDFDIEETGECVACTSSFFNKYKHTPKDFAPQNKEENIPVIDYEKLGDIIANKLNIKPKEETLQNNIEKEKKDILKDLDSLGI